MDGVRQEEITFVSTDGMSKVHGYIWWPSPEHELIGVVQIVHGMCEHIERYDGFARWLAAAGFVVAGHDQVGHGQTTPRDQWGVLPAKTGRDVLVGDVQRLRELVSSKAPGVPYFVYGHSMGSFVVRAYLSEHATGLAGAVICGTGFVKPATSRLGNRLACLIASVRGDAAKSNLLHSMADGPYSKAIPNARTDFDWLSHNEENVQRYIADPACGFMFSAGGYATLTQLTAEVCVAECTKAYPAALPLLYIGGAEDPVGDCGKGVREAADLARSTGSTDVTCTVYDGMRHEILNETGHERVFTDVLAWLQSKLPQKEV